MFKKINISNESFTSAKILYINYSFKSVEVITGNIDGSVKAYNVETFNIFHQWVFSYSVLSINISININFISLGMENSTIYTNKNRFQYNYYHYFNIVKNFRV